MRLILSSFFILISLTLSAQKMQPTDYNAWWKKIETLVSEKGLYRDGLTEVNSLYKKAKAEKQEAQQIRALVYRLEIQEQIEEFSDTLAISNLTSEAQTGSGASKSIIHAILASYYQRYYNRYRWQMYERTATVNFKKDNIRSWSPADFHLAISDHFRLALENTTQLQATPLNGFDPIIRKGNVRHLRPTLYDLLAWYALEYFESDPIEIPRAANAYSMRDPQLFSPVSSFIKLRLSDTDSSSHLLRALGIYQQLLQMHHHDKDQEALADADLHRIRFVEANIILPEKQKVFLQTLEQFSLSYPGTAAADMGQFLRAESLASREPADNINALEICEKLVAANRNNEASARAFNLAGEIKAANLSLVTERVNIPGQPFRALLSWKNLSKVKLRMYKINPDLRKKLSDRHSIFDSAQWISLSREKPIIEWEQPLPYSNDYLQHHTEIKIGALPIGEYLVLAGDNPDFMLKTSTMAASFFHVSNISYVNRDHDYILLHRNNGHPLAKASVQLWHREYDYQQRQYRHLKGNSYVTNDNGYVKLISGTEKQSRSFRLEITYGDDRLFLDEEEYNYVYQPDDKPAQSDQEYEANHVKLYFFTDRGIYRPGQTVHFKGIAVTKDATTKKNKLYTAKSTTVKLFDANGEEIDSLQLTTNQYGSYAGSFKLPETGLTGTFRLEDNTLNGDRTVEVEEYKRPKFFADFETPKGSYRVNDSVTVKGFAKAYAGNTISNAAITYRVIRTARFLYPWRLGKIGWPQTESQEIAHGNLQTSADGSFSISFPAIPDEQVDRNTDPVFDYEITADITDINGETRSATTIVPVSYKALQLSISPIQSVMTTDEFRQLKLLTRNLSGQYERSKVTVNIRPLLSPGRLVRERLWEQPDLFVMTEAEFIAAFPNDEYRNESNPASWQTGAVIWQKTDSSKADGKMAIDIKKIQAGWYQLEANTIDRFGDTVTDKSTVYLFDPKEKTLPVPQYITSRQDRTTAQPGETALITIGSSADNLYIFRQKENTESRKSQKELPFSGRFEVLRLDNGIHTETVPVTESDRGGIGMYWLFVKHNRFYSIQNGVAVPWLNKELDIRLQTWRDKTLPGSEENWTVTISGSKGEKVAAELLTGLYDASLDQFVPNQWEKPEIWPRLWVSANWKSNNNFGQSSNWTEQPELFRKEVPVVQYDQLLGTSPEIQRMMYSSQTQRAMKKEAMADTAKPPADATGVLNEVVMAKATTAKVVKDEELSPERSDEKTAEQLAGKTPAAATIRKDFRETAFFFPQLNADEAGNYSFSFTMPEALTTWKWQLLAHSTDLAMGLAEKTIITQKELMVQPNMPRFLREGDRMEFSTKIVNLSDKEMTGQAELQLIDATTNQPVDGWFRNFFPNQYFTVAAGGSEAVNFPIEVPYLFEKALTWRIIARSGDISDGEEASLPVLSNRQLVTESMPFFINGSGTKKYTLNKLVNSKESETLSHRALTVEFSANPVWYAVQSLPYLADYPYECSEQTFNRLYANMLAAHIVARMPKIRTIMERWQTQDTSALLSNLQKNQELKTVLLEETPWVLEAKSESEQKILVAQLFNLVQLAANREKLSAKLAEMQTSNGGFSWFTGGPDDRFITQYIVTGIGHLKKLGAIPQDFTAFNNIVEKALPYLDVRLKEDYDRRDKNPTAVSYLNYYAVQYHYMRSFFPEKGIAGPVLPAANHYRKEIQKNWIKGNRMAKGMIALALFRTGDPVTAKKIMASLEQTAINNEELGMYWKDNTLPYYWQDAPIESQALLIEAFSEVTQQTKTVGALKAWLLRNKQTNHWQSTKATADACYALLLKGDNWLEHEPKVSVDLGGVTTITASQAEAGTGYYKKSIPGSAVQPEMGQITVKAAYPSGTAGAGSKSDMPVWGAVYWQYFENLDKITPASTPLKLSKQVMVERLTNTGPVLEPVTEGMQLKVGDKLKVRLEITTDRNMEYVHVKDMRASALEPVNVLSGYRWQGSLGYYESTRDASTSFFINFLPKGTHVMEYALFISHAGIFSNGISTIQCMYAPEFTSHSEGVRIMVE
ncbi:alpha-2-macroglobulin [Flavihumibacter stibioxidans]|uniref:Alpha-2-macroglobulin domain-containing protein n=1 Tax=Flavihumibacter stibioxidans TaxID=1834163 RepID=A0ABR7MD24_9BACT|nr:MG2 domain-containing protein [Flavihumibacter stibioxidans]MBC6492930.1 hypothetical protein [Flavihumibacter stibioxidans]